MKHLVSLFLVLFLATNLSQGIKTYTNKKERLNNNSIWLDYEKRADIYLSRDRFYGSPINGKILTKCAMAVHDSIGVFIPVEFALAQAQWESGMGLKGRTPKNNPCNLGEYTNKTVLTYQSTIDGMMAYYFLIAKNYLDYGNKTIFDLFKNNMRDKNGYRYASSDTYGKRIGKQYNFIVKWINKNKNKIK